MLRLLEEEVIRNLVKFQAHNGVLFLDELPEFKRCFKVMRQPLEDREVTISRAKFTVTYPSVYAGGSMNPSPSGFFKSRFATNVFATRNATVFE
jgi:predicted ATPase with chaperone activity